ncbi:MAG: magnesium transporter [Bacteroidetes bacterium]|nr:MAG: magnesium transporter [Bacteroidota bacterium]REK07063.1 MAG: magnesium transporter [Bacteroidota bacterium]REK33591.1 MAG: magnesium transporter [Bacteroidota bacterium]REK48575.1 MAG: magnesium transporter [Bacteroidota bacterium]
MISTEEKEIFAERLFSGNLYKLKQLASEISAEELAEYINGYKEIDFKKIFQVLDPEKAIKTFENLDFEIQMALLRSFSVEQLSSTLNQISPDDRTALFEQLPQETLQRYLSLLTDAERKTANQLLQYPEDSIGRLMTTDFISVRPDWTVQQTLDFIRTYGKYSETMNFIYVTDEQGFLLDDIKLNQLLLVPLDSKISDLMEEHYVSLQAKDDQETAIDAFKQYNREALPVTDFNGLLLGIITIDDIVDVIEEEDTEDIQKFGGTEALEDQYLKVSVREMINKRAVWLVILFVGETLTASAMGFFKTELDKAVILALFVPLIISSGGNSGSQAATLIIRAMALGEVTLENWWQVTKREFASGLALGTFLGILGFLKVLIWTIFSDVYGEHWLLVGLTVGITLIGVVMFGTLSGSLFPLLLKRLGKDPAVSSAPFIATLVDVTGIVLYFTLAYFILKGTLL